MVVLTGENLGKRQHDLNKQVSKAAVDFEQLKKQPNDTDIDILFKIDVASRYKKANFIIDMLKSGDSLYISRALKCTWLYHTEYASYINVDYLHHSVFPSMSAKMKRKLLTTISMHLNNEVRCKSFYKYCISARLNNIALKFLIFTSEPFKREVINTSFVSIMNQEETFYRHFVGNSFGLAKCILDKASEYTRTEILYYLRYLMSVSQGDYLDLFEIYDNYKRKGKRFGLRISKQIMKKHKRRYLEHPLLYMDRLNKDVIVKRISVSSAQEIIAKALRALPEAKTFWEINFCKKFDYLINKIPANDKLMFMKNTFHDKFPEEIFEMNKKFFELGYTFLMTDKEKEEWAIRHIDWGTELKGSGRNYLWYEYVSYEKAFPEIKSTVMKKTDYSERKEVVEVLIKAARNQSHIHSLLTYYHDRHSNEPQNIKERFVESLLREHNVFEFDIGCWAALNKVLHNLKVYKTIDGCENYLIMYMTIMYHIIRNIDLPEVLKKFLLEHGLRHLRDKEILYKRVSKENLQQVFDYITNLYVDKITTLFNEPDHDPGDIYSYIDRYVNYIAYHKKTSEDCAPIITEFVNSNRDLYKYSAFFRVNKENLTEAMLLRELKKDSNKTVEKLSELRDVFTEQSSDNYINTFLKKLKIYFPNDIAKEYLQFFLNTLQEEKITLPRGIVNIVYGIFQLADNQTKIDFMNKYEPTDPKINNETINAFFLGVQEAICKSVCFSRPPMPLPNVLKYIKGDYLKYCLPIFQSYQAKLPQNLLQEFVIALIDTPVSVQKHALRLVFECFSLEDLKKTIRKTWRNTKNISVRYVLYHSLFNKICIEEEGPQAELFELLKEFTSQLNDDDHSEIFDRYVNGNKLPNHLLGAYIKICWHRIYNFENNTENYRIKTKVIENINNSISKVEPEFVKEIAEEHEEYMLDQKHLRPQYGNEALDALNNAKWKLVAKYIVYFASNANYLELNLDLMRSILHKCLNMWNVIHDDIHTARQFFWTFIDDLIAVETEKCCGDAIPILETVETFLIDLIPLKQMYKSLWSLKLSILRRQQKQSIKASYYNNRNLNIVHVIKNSICEYGLKVAKLVEENVISNTYFITANDTIAEIIKDNVDSIIAIKIDHNLGPNLHEIMRDRYVLVASGLIEINAKETLLLALYVLPLESDAPNFPMIVEHIEHFNDEEVQYCWFNKYNRNTVKRRRLR
ncbi:uncharacterized protein LOC106138517 [Amyelois transitella]|uniref:uncharacterized protein LOC106138517 n=1 Tax=Amyelois transitella TaxID=680683 RepID=UPI00299053E7|nr:uncharacterized protein LOC106138517 [Amyelois transitella]